LSWISVKSSEVQKMQIGHAKRWVNLGAVALRYEKPQSLRS
jgi:hypothetical protein